MNFYKFLLDNLGMIGLFLVSTLLTTLTISMEVIKVNGELRRTSIIYAFVINLLLLMIYLIFKYIMKKKLYNSLEKTKKTKDPGYISSLPNTISRENELYKESLESVYYNYENKLVEYDKREKLYRDFNNIWIHQMKTPISVINLLIENGLESKRDLLSLKEEVDKLDDGLNMALYNLRLQDFNLDFKVEKVNLNNIARNSINNNKNSFILNSIYPKVNIDEDILVSTDKKWIEFIFNQIVQNSIKYTKVKDIDKKEIIIDGKMVDKNIEISFFDNGVGIDKKDLNRLFKPFFTGENGRKYEESTGMGLYLSKIILDNLGHRISVESSEGEYTKVKIVFVEEKSIYNI